MTSGKQDKKRKNLGEVDSTVVDAEKKQDKNTGNLPKGPVYDPHDPGDSKLDGAAGLWRRAGPITPEFRWIVDELVKPRNKRDNKRLMALRGHVLDKLKAKNQDKLISLADNPRSLAYLLGQYDLGVVYLPFNLVQGLFRLFNKKPGPERSDARLRAEDYVSRNKEMLRDMLEKQGPPWVTNYIKRQCECTPRIAREVAKEAFGPFSSKKHPPKNSM